MGKLGVRETLRFSLVMVLLAVALFSGILSGVAAQDGQNMSAEEKSKIRSFFPCFFSSSSFSLLGS